MPTLASCTFLEETGHVPEILPPGSLKNEVMEAEKRLRQSLRRNMRDLWRLGS